MNPTKTLHQQWQQLGQVMVDETDRINEPFMHFAPGTTRQVIWKWFDRQYRLAAGVPYKSHGKTWLSFAAYTLAGMVIGWVFAFAFIGLLKFFGVVTL